MKSNQDFAALAQQVQALAAIVEELTKQNQEMKLRLQQEENQSKGSPEDEGNSQKRSDHQRPISPDDQNSDFLREMRKEMNELRSAIKEKTKRRVDRLVRATDSPFTTAVLECPVPSKFRLPQLESFDGLKDLKTTLTPSRRLWAFSSPLTKYYVVPFPLLSKELQENGSPNCQRRQWIASSS